MLLYFLSIACTPMDKPGTPFQPVKTVSHLTLEVGDEEEKEDVDTTEPVDDEFRSKEEIMIGGVEEASSEAEVEVESDDSNVDLAPLEEKVTAAPSEAIPQESQNEIQEMAEPVSNTPQPAFTNFGWPIRVVKTDMTLVPPRAIIGLPDGTEVVVQSGHMIPQHNLVVMSIGAKVVGFAKIHAQGDHAKVETIELLSQN